MPRYHLFGETVTTAEEIENKGVPGRVAIRQALNFGVFLLSGFFVRKT